MIFYFHEKSKVVTNEIFSTKLNTKLNSLSQWIQEHGFSLFFECLISFSLWTQRNCFLPFVELHHSIWLNFSCHFPSLLFNFMSHWITEYWIVVSINTTNWFSNNYELHHLTSLVMEFFLTINTRKLYSIIFHLY